jgi:hypothetical protein
MKIEFFLYTEDDAPFRDGPYYSLEDAMKSSLWELQGVCLWIENVMPGAFVYFNVKSTGAGWVTTSYGRRPLPPYRPECLFLGKDVARSIELSAEEQEYLAASRVEASRQRKEREVYRSMFL